MCKSSFEKCEGDLLLYLFLEIFEIGGKNKSGKRIMVIVVVRSKVRGVRRLEYEFFEERDYVFFNIFIFNF